MFYPKPLQKPHPPIWVGGESPARPAPCRQARRRLVSRQQQPDEAARHAGAPGRRHRRGEAHGRSGRARSRRASASPAGAEPLRVGPRRRPRTARRGGCSRAPPRTWPPMPRRSRRWACATSPCGWAALPLTEARRTHRPLRPRGDRPHTSEIVGRNRGFPIEAEPLFHAPRLSSRALCPGSTSQLAPALVEGWIPATDCRDDNDGFPLAI